MSEQEHRTNDTSERNYVTIDKPFRSAGETIEGQASIALRDLALPEGATPLDNREMRLRRVMLEPGGVIAAHPHENRPTILYIAEGTLVEYSDDNDFAVEHSAPAIIVPTSTHWWRNAGAQAVVIIGADLFDPDDDDAPAGTD